MEKRSKKTEALTSSDTKEPSKSDTSHPAINTGDIITLDGFGGEVELNDGKKTTLKKLVDASNSGVVLFTYPRASTPGCKLPAFPPYGIFLYSLISMRTSVHQTCLVISFPLAARILLPDVHWLFRETHIFQVQNKPVYSATTMTNLYRLAYLSMAFQRIRLSQIPRSNLNKTYHIPLSVIPAPR